MRNWAALCCEFELPIGSQDDCEQGRLEMEYFAGIDVSLRSCALCIVDGTRTNRPPFVWGRAVTVSTLLDSLAELTQLRGSRRGLYAA
jgi:hypothetical protein